MGTARLSAHRFGGLLLFRAAGLFNESAAQRLQALRRIELARRPAVKALLDLRRAVLLLTKSQLEVLDHGEPALATGLLVDPAYEAMVREYCWSAVTRGMTRLTFTDPSEALRWVEVPVPGLRPLRPFEPASLGY